MQSVQVDMKCSDASMWRGISNEDVQREIKIDDYAWEKSPWRFFLNGRRIKLIFMRKILTWI